MRPRAIRSFWLVPMTTGLLVSVGAAQSPDPLAAAPRDPMALARAVDRIGDDALLERLAAESRPERLTAVHAAPWMHSPELALAPLASMARGRDPELAPAATRAALLIARRLDAGALFLRETPIDDLRAAADGFRQLGEDDTARADLRAAARVVVAQLSDAGVGGAPEAP